MTSAAKLSKSIEKVIIEVLLLYSGAVDNAIHLLLAARKLRHRRHQPAGVAHPCAQQPAQRHPTRANQATTTILLQKISRITLVRFIFN